MSSPFEIIDQSEGNTSSFWQPVNKPLPSNSIIFSSMLYLPTKSNQLKPRLVSLTNSHIYRFGKLHQAIKKISCIYWKKLESFTETNDEEERFGFRLGFNSNFQDFYTKNSLELDTWIKHLGSLVILSDFKEDFVVLKTIGKGNYGSVKLVVDRHTHEQYAMKYLASSLLQNNMLSLLNLKNEIQVLRSLDHPGVMKLDRVYEENSKVYLIFKYYPDKDLFDRLLTVNRYSEKTASALAFNLLETVAYMHSKSFIHRDLKLENILMRSGNSDSEIVVCDFGLACCSKDVKNIPKCGSPGYVAPEILFNEDYTTKVDIFSVGVIVYILLSGNSPFEASTKEKVLLKNKECKVKFKGKIWKKHSRLASDFILSLMNPDPELRPSAREALNHPWIIKFGDVVKRDATPLTDCDKNWVFELSRLPTVKM